MTYLLDHHVDSNPVTDKHHRSIINFSYMRSSPDISHSFIHLSSNSTPRLKFDDHSTPAPMESSFNLNCEGFRKSYRKGSRCFSVFFSVFVFIVVLTLIPLASALEKSRDFYRILRVPRTATLKQIKKVSQLLSPAYQTS